MAAITMKELLEAGVHFGHQTKRWNIPIPQGRISAGRIRPLCRHQTPSGGKHQGGGRAEWHVLREPSLARGNLDQLPDHS